MSVQDDIERLRQHWEAHPDYVHPSLRPVKWDDLRAAMMKHVPTHEDVMAAAKVADLCARYEIDGVQEVFFRMKAIFDAWCASLDVPDEDVSDA